jgi:ribosome recycling factor
MVNDVIKDTDGRMKKAIEAMKRDMGTVRTGRASTALVEGIRVDYYGSSTPLMQLASVTVPEPRMLVIQPWDGSAIKEIEKAIMASDLGLTPMNDGKVIRLGIPHLTDERRRDLTKAVKKNAEDYRVEIRNLRRDAKETLEQSEKEHAISEDDLRRGLKEVQDLTDKTIKEIDRLLEVKEKEILEV